MPSGLSFFSLSLSFSATLLSEYPKSTSAKATRFSVLASSSAFSDPIPPNPITAKFMVSLGAWNPTPPRTWRGTIITPRPIFPVSATNFRRVNFLGVICCSSSIFSTGRPRQSERQVVQILVAVADGGNRVGRLIMLDEIVLDPGLIALREDGREVDGAG